LVDFGSAKNIFGSMKQQKSLSTSYENKKLQEGFHFVVGCDEVGRGCLAGPVVAAAVMFDFKNSKLKIKNLDGINDSKQLSEKQREKFNSILQSESRGGLA